MTKQHLFVDVFPLIALFLAGYAVGSQFETLWLRFAVGLPVGISAFFLYRKLGEFICREEGQE